MHTCVHKAKKYENVARVHMGVRAMCHTHTRSEGVRARLADALQADRRVRAHLFLFFERRVHLLIRAVLSSTVLRCLVCSNININIV